MGEFTRAYAGNEPDRHNTEVTVRGQCRRQTIRSRSDEKRLCPTVPAASSSLFRRPKSRTSATNHGIDGHSEELNGGSWAHLLHLISAARSSVDGPIVTVIEHSVRSRP